MQSTIKLTQFSQKLYKCSQDQQNLHENYWVYLILTCPLSEKKKWYWAAKISTIKTQIGRLFLFSP